MLVNMLLQMEETYSENTTPTLLFWDCCEYNLRQNIQNGNIDSKISYFILREQRLPGKGAHSRPICNGTQTAAYAPGLHGRTSQPPEPPARDAKNRTANPARHAYPTTVFTFRRAPVRPSARRPTKARAVLPQASAVQGSASVPASKEIRTTGRPGPDSAPRYAPARHNRPTPPDHNLQPTGRSRPHRAPAPANRHTSGPEAAHRICAAPASRGAQPAAMPRQVSSAKDHSPSRVMP